MTEATVPTAVTVDLQCRSNGFMHHTREYQLNEQRSALVVRRGAPFRLFLRFNTDVTEFNIVALSISTDSFGQKHLERSWILKEISRRLHDDPAHDCPLQMTLLKSKSDSNTICLQMSSKNDAVISKFDITKVTLFRAAPGQSVTLDTSGSIILIYNPFHIDDQVFMGVEKERHEFVMEDTGLLFLRNPQSRWAPGKPWFFGQFESPTLECTLALLSKSQLPWEDWSDPVKVSRALSAVVNSQDENGLLVGNWSGDYSGGRNPTEWTGSLKIFQEFQSSGGKPVMFGQCWVFSGCLTSAGRTLGIPTRSVTNFSSAHDTNANLLIDRYFHASGERFEDKTRDSVWNFHVWNEMWMTRPDLSDAGYRGWQVLDATPQELSGDLYQAGPCPVVAIKQGEINVPFDAAFIYAEVNACVKKWVTRDNGETWTEALSDSRGVGEFISTKAVGSSTRHDLTSLYKYDEGSREEQDTFERARRLTLEGGGGSSDRLPDAPGSGEAEAKVWQLRVGEAPDAVHFGQDAVLEVVAKNVSDQERLGTCFCAVVLVNSYGRRLKTLDAGRLELKLQAGEEIAARLVLKADYYMEFGHEEVDIVVTAGLTDSDNRMQTIDHVIGIVYPDLLVKVPSKVTRRSTTQITLEMKNDLSKPLTGAKFVVEGPGLRTTGLEQRIDDVPPGGLATATFSLAFYRAGPVNLVASFSSNEMTGVFKQASFYVDY